MKLLTRRRPAVLPGLLGTLRTPNTPGAPASLSELLPRLRPGDVVLLDHPDLDRADAQALLDAGVVAVLNTAPVLSGRFPSLGPLLLAEAGVLLVDGVAPVLADDGSRPKVRDGRTVRLHEGEAYDAGRLLLRGREVDAGLVRVETEAARDATLAQLDGFTHSSAELLRREQDLILHGLGLPTLTAHTGARRTRTRTPTGGRPALVVGRDATAEDVRAVRRWVREQDPVVLAVGAGADLVVEDRMRVDVVVVCEESLPSARALDTATDVVVCGPAGTRPAPALDQRRDQVRTLRTAAAGEDAALLLAGSGEPPVIVGVGLHVGLQSFLDRTRPTQASAYLTRLAVGHLLVDAAAISELYAGRVRPRHVALVLLLGLAALAVAVAVTPVGQGWYADLPSWWDHLVDGLRGRAHGIVGTGQ